MDTLLRSPRVKPESLQLGNVLDIHGSPEVVGVVVNLDGSVALTCRTDLQPDPVKIYLGSSESAA